ncbi:MAG TPA: hypothetical protein VHC69_32390 [Polyangiaceae bacterium]|nr:hypothetical protein [Polyangiaceae bacterium]
MTGIPPDPALPPVADALGAGGVGGFTLMMPVLSPCPVANPPPAIVPPLPAPGTTAFPVPPAAFEPNPLLPDPVDAEHAATPSPNPMSAPESALRSELRALHSFDTATFLGTGARTQAHTGK